MASDTSHQERILRTRAAMAAKGIELTPGQVEEHMADVYRQCAAWMGEKTGEAWTPELARGLFAKLAARMAIVRDIVLDILREYRQVPRRWLVDGLCSDPGGELGITPELARYTIKRMLADGQLVKVGRNVTLPEAK